MADLGTEIPGIRDVERAAALLEGQVLRTPLLPLQLRTGLGDVWVKCENLQHTGAFKARGALHYLLRLLEVERPQGVTTFSSGNHGNAVAWAAAQQGIPAKIFVPETIPQSKALAIQSHGATLVHAGTTSRHRQEACEDAARREQLHIIPPFDHSWIIAGQGTVGLEILEQVNTLDRVLVPVGGGGLISGIATAIRARRPSVQVIGVEPMAAASMAAALQQGAPVEIVVGDTIADGLKPVQVGALCAAIAKQHVDRIVTVTDAAIAAAVLLLLHERKLIVEPSGAVPLAALLMDPTLSNTGTTVLVLSGGNADLERLQSLRAVARA